MADRRRDLFVVTNSETFHVSLPEAPFTTLCGRGFTPASCSVVTEKPGRGFKMCATCEKRR